MRNPYTIIAAIALAVAACDDIDTADRLIYVEPAEVGRTVLLEDFTGQRCVNCPTAIEEIEHLQQQYGDSAVIAVGIHSGPFGKTVLGKPTPLYTETGDEYFSYWKLETQPIGIVNRTGIYNYTDWAAAVRTEIQKTAPVTINIQSGQTETDSTFNAKITLTCIDANPVSGKLQLWLTEDSIDNYQLLPDGSRQEHYIHNHVFRTAINGTWGDDVALSSGESKTIDYPITVSSAWNANHCSVVAFIYDDAGVKQAARAKLK